MMRVFRPTSPMNMGVWILSGAAPTAITTGLLINRRGRWGQIGEVSGYLSGVFGAALAGYTGVLVSNTAIPVWQQARRWVPPMFMASSAAAAASVIDLVSADDVTRSVTRVFGAIGRAAEIVATLKTEHAASAIPKVGEALHRGWPAVLWKSATALTAVSLGLSLFAGKSRRRVVTAGWLGAAGSLCLRLAVHSVGNASVLDPRASFHQQRSK
jgi:formate-dependent nitrite reductase membrane component NrfD